MCGWKKIQNVSNSAVWSPGDKWSEKRGAVGGRGKKWNRLPKGGIKIEKNGKNRKTSFCIKNRGGKGREHPKENLRERALTGIKNDTKKKSKQKIEN